MSYASTSKHYDTIIKICKDIFVKKMKDYGTAWRILRLASITDQIFIKAQRIRSVEEKGTHKIDDSIEQEYLGIVNYCVIALIQLEMNIAKSDVEQSEVNEIISLFDKHISNTKSLMEQKNHDYGEAWKDMRINSMTDLILMKILRIKQIENNEGKTLISEGVESNYRDIINYSVFALMKLNLS